MGGLSTIILLLASIVSALMAGLFYAYTFSVMPGLAQVSDTAFIAAMQSINRAIQNPIFFVAFMGTPLLLPVTSYQNFSSPMSLRFWLLVSATIIYLVGVLGVTMIGNIPLNNALDKFNLANASADAISKQRLAFEGPWNSLNMIRTLASIATSLLVIGACLSPSDK